MSQNMKDPSAPMYQMQQPVPVQFTLQPVLGPQSCRMNCPSCQASISTRTELKPSSKTHIAALILCLFCFCCVCVPYCVDTGKDVHHTCPSCNAYIGKYEG